MTEEYEDELVTSHSDENPELNPNAAGDNPLAAYTTEGSPADDLKKEKKDPFHYQARAGETVVYEEVYIPPDDAA